jgi:DNA-binding FadR family transcriptional regulator
VRHGYEGGVFVAEAGAVPLLAVLQTSLGRGQVSIPELYQARVLVEPPMARLAVARDAAALHTKLAVSVARAEAALAAGANAFGANLEFHALLAEAAGNRVLGLIMQALLDLLHQLDREYPTNPDVSRHSLEEHQQVLEAVRAGDAAAVERLMQAHLLRLEGRFVDIEARGRERPGARPRAARRAGSGSARQSNGKS